MSEILDDKSYQIMEENAWLDYPLEKIKKSLNPEIVSIYYQTLEELATEPIGKQVVQNKAGASIREIYTTICQLKLEKSSHYFFPSNHVVNFYPSIGEKICAKETTCDFSNGKIRKGELYCFYRPFLHDLTSGNRYVLKRSIKVEIAYLDFLPMDFNEFELFSEKVDHYWNYPTDVLDYERINYNVKGALALQQLKTRKLNR